jgi:hypothetical protein
MSEKMFLTKNSLEQWVNKLPDDIKSVIQSDVSYSLTEDHPLIKGLSELDEGMTWDALEMVSQYPEAVEAIGRDGRVRLMAWLSNNTKHELKKKIIFRILTGQLNEEDSDDGTEKGDNMPKSVALLFLNDIKSITNIIAIRMAPYIKNEENLRRILETTNVVSKEYKMKKSGGI